MAVKPKTKASTIVKLQIPAGKATPAPPVGSILGPHGINIMNFVKEFNDRTKELDTIVPVVITIKSDKTFTFVVKSPPAAVLIKKACGINKGSSVPHKDKVAKITVSSLEEIAKIKEQDLNASSLESAVSMLSGTARSMGVEVEG